MKILAYDTVIGVVLVRGIALPHRKQDYMNLALLIARVCGLSLTNTQQSDTLRWQEHRYRTLFQQSSDAIVLVQPETGEFLEFNMRAYNDLGYSEAMFEGMSLYDLIPDDKAPEIERYLQLVIEETGKPHTIEVQHQTQDNQLRSRLLTSSLLDLNDEHIILSTWIDITERKALEEEKAIARQLHIELQKEQELSTLKSKFIATVSHEFRTPLAIILSSSDIIRTYGDRMTESNKQEKHANISNAVRRMVHLLDEMLRFENVSQNDDIRLDEDINVLYIIQQITASFQHEFVLNLSTENNQIKGNRALFNEVLSNIIENAVKFTSTTPIHITTTKSQQKQIIICVEDQGIGIPKEEQSRVFEPFFRSSNAINIPGVGLGLAITLRAIKRLNGKIQISSGKSGTRVEIEL